ncbi:MAG TPA: hypothetical protein VHN20_18045 [Beijerinckiaceae bacterium]|nr:hypothetical protein [Beijerinckiaceae bacterium]
MRFRAHILTALMVLSASASAAAEPGADHVVALFKDVCISPATPAEMMSVGEKTAAASGWKVVRSGPAPIPMLHNENGPELALISGWVADLAGAPGSHVFISIVGPELPDLKYTFCMVRPSADFTREDLVSALEVRVGSLLSRVELEREAREDRPSAGTSAGRVPAPAFARPPKEGWHEAWVFNDEIKDGLCGKKVTFSRSHSPPEGMVTMLLFTEFDAPANYAGSTAATRCDRPF